MHIHTRIKETTMISCTDTTHTYPTPPPPHTQLSDFLAPQLPRVGGMMTLPDVYCLFNRARGTELVSPDDLLVTCRLLPSVGGGLQLHTLQSGAV